jgi:hypothetical protein
MPVVLMAIEMPFASACERWSAATVATALNASIMPKMVPRRPSSVAMLAMAAIIEMRFEIAGVTSSSDSSMAEAMSASLLLARVRPAFITRASAALSAALQSLMARSMLFAITSFWTWLKNCPPLMLKRKNRKMKRSTITPAPSTAQRAMGCMKKPPA